MEYKKKIKILMILVIVLSIIVISGLGYLIVDKFFNNSDDVNNINDAVDQKENHDESSEDEKESLSTDEFVNLLKGYWANAVSSDNLVVIFEDDVFVLGYFASEAAIKSPIQELEKVSDNEYKFLAGNNFVYIDLSEVDEGIIYVRIDENPKSKYIFVSTDYNETFNYFFN